MPSLSTEGMAKPAESPLSFGTLERRRILADFQGGGISSDGGLPMIRQVD